MQRHGNWIIFVLATAVASQFYFMYTNLKLVRTELDVLRPTLDQAQLKIQDLEKKDAESLKQLQETLSKIQAVEKTGTENSQKLKDAQQKIQTIEKTASTSVTTEASQPNPDFAALKTKVDAIAAASEASKQAQNAIANVLVDHERLESFLTMRNVPAAVRHWFTYSQTVSAKLDALEGDHPEVIDHIRKYKLVPPPAPYFRTKEKPADWSRGNGHHLLHIFQNKSDGFFIECGAYDGLWLSNTFYVERLLNWTGVMIEAEPFNFELAEQKHRNVFLVPGCLSLTTKTKLSGFRFGHHVYSKIDTTNTLNDTVQVQCLPLYSILLALNRTTIDLFSLDIEGHELDVIKTIPFDKVDIKVFIVEFKFIKEGKKGLEDFMLSKGYVIYPSVPEERTFQKWAEDDHIFIKKGCGYKETRP